MATVDVGDVSFDQVGVADLIGSVTAVPQALDNQWFDRDLLAKVFQSGEVGKEVEAERNRKARTEYLRSLLAADKVILNRAYLFNHPGVYGDFLHDGPNKEAFRDLLREGTILPCLLGEATPVPRTQPDFETAEGLDAWRRVAETTSMSCIRLSWDDDENTRLVNEMFREYNKFILDFAQFDARALRRDLVLPDEAHAESLLKRLRAVARFVLDELEADRPITRDLLYKTFVVADGKSVTKHRFDAGKAHAAEVKQLLDLKYATNLADFIDVFSITPADSPRRTALQESALTLRGRDMKEPVLTDSEQLIHLLRNLAFENVQELLEAVPSLSKLSLADVRDVRGEREWESYQRVFSSVVNSASLETLTDPDVGAEAVAKAYLQMLGKAEEISASRRLGEVGERSEGFTQIGIDVGSLTVNFFFLKGHSPAVEVIGDTIGMAASRAAKVTIRLGMGRILERNARRRIDNTAQILTLRMENPDREARRLLDYVNKSVQLEPGKGNGSDLADEDE
jgi:hypothetical protein